MLNRDLFDSKESFEIAKLKVAVSSYSKKNKKLKKQLLEKSEEIYTLKGEILKLNDELSKQKRVIKDPRLVEKVENQRTEINSLKTKIYMLERELEKRL